MMADRIKRLRQREPVGYNYYSYPLNRYIENPVRNLPDGRSKLELIPDQPS